MPSVSDYTAPGRFTDLSKCRKSLLQNLPSDTESLMQLVRGCVISPSQLRSGGLSVPTDRLIERNIRPAVEMIERMHDLFAAELTIRRPPELRLIGSCRHFATLTCALLRHYGIPARVRAGFAGYFESATYYYYVK